MAALRILTLKEHHSVFLKLPMSLEQTWVISKRRFITICCCAYLAPVKPSVLVLMFLTWCPQHGSAPAEKKEAKV